MIDLRPPLKSLMVAALAGYVTLSGAGAQVLSEDADDLLDQLAAEADPAEAGRLAQEVLERWSHSGSPALDLMLARGEAAMRDEDWPRAIAHLTVVTDTAPDFAEGWATRAEAFFLMERYGAALADIEQALILEPRHFEALSGLGIVLERLGLEGAALTALLRAQTIYPAEPNIGEAVERLEIQTGGRTL